MWQWCNARTSLSAPVLLVVALFVFLLNWIITKCLYFDTSFCILSLIFSPISITFLVFVFFLYFFLIFFSFFYSFPYFCIPSSFFSFLIFLFPHFSLYFCIPSLLFVFISSYLDVQDSGVRCSIGRVCRFF